MEVDRNGLVVLPREECLRLLATARLGRLGISLGALPTVLPVNFRLVDDRIVFRTGIGTKLDAATCNQVVAFEVDDLDAMSHTGWSVMVTGTATEVVDQVARERLMSLGIPHWTPGRADRLVAVATDRVTGRRIDDVRRAPTG